MKLLVAFLLCASVDSGRLKLGVNLNRIFGVPMDINDAEIIMKEESAKLDMTTAQLIRGCNAVVTNAQKELSLTAQEEASVRAELKASEKITDNTKFTSTAEVWKHLETHYPILNGLVKKKLPIAEKLFISTLDDASKNFFRDSVKRLLDIIVEYSQFDLEKKKNSRAVALIMKKTIEKIHDDYKALPQESKNKLETRFCFHSYYRLMNTMIKEGDKVEMPI